LKSSKVKLILAMLAATLVVLPSAQAWAGPASIEYGFEPISGVGNDKPIQSGLSLEKEAVTNPVAGSDGGSFAGDFLDAVASSWLIIVALVLVAALSAFLVARHRGTITDRRSLMARGAALLAVAVAIPLVSLGTAESAKRAAAPKGFFGTLTQTGFTSPDAVRMSRGGIESIRMPLPWPSVQPNGSYEFDWTSIDDFVKQASVAGLTVLPYLYDSPGWATPVHTRMPVYNDAQRKAWRDFVTAAVKRYGPQGEFWQEHGPGSASPVPKRPIRNWQIWNEANFFYFSTPVSPRDYVNLLKIASKAVRSVDPKAKVYLSGLYGSPPKKEIRKGRAMASWVFLDRLYRLGAKPWFDFAALHPYTPNTGQTRALMNKFRKVMIRYRDRATPVSITEVGWGSARKGFLDVGSPQKQARQVTSAYRYFISNWRKLNLRSVYWFAWKDKPRSEESCNFCYSTGLFKAGKGLKAKPAWRSMVRLAGGKP